ncbi:MAG TPA: tetratricopeptide repeat protein [Pirellulales bacterium]|nr:tetratricopeptide repeat protein [Pirellulales bacterium]
MVNFIAAAAVCRVSGLSERPHHDFNGSAKLGAAEMAGRRFCYFILIWWSFQAMATNVELYDEAARLKDAGDLEGAVAKLEALVAQDANYPLAHSALAVILGRLKRHEEAVKHAQKVCQLAPNDAFSFTAMSVTYQRAGKIPEAEDAMARARMMQGH